MIGATGIEPVTSGSQNQHSTAELRPDFFMYNIRSIELCQPPEEHHEHKRKVEQNRLLPI